MAQLSLAGNCAVIVAHPDDETLWSGGTVLMHPKCQWTIVTLCRKSDPDRAPRFLKVLKELKARGAMGDLDDGPQQAPLSSRYVQNCILELLAANRFDVILTHDIRGEYTRHRRHEEIASAVLALRRNGMLHCRQLLTFAYEDGGGKYLPRPIRRADFVIGLRKRIWRQKYRIITDVYGFSHNSFEARTTPEQEAFWQSGDKAADQM